MIIAWRRGGWEHQTNRSENWRDSLWVRDVELRKKGDKRKIFLGAMSGLGEKLKNCFREDLVADEDNLRAFVSFW